MIPRYWLIPAALVGAALGVFAISVVAVGARGGVR